MDSTCDDTTQQNERADARQHAASIRRTKIHGDKLGSKPDGVVRIVFENWDGCAPWKARNKKLIEARRFVRRISADAYLGAETRANWKQLPHQNLLPQLFQSETEIRAIAAHNQNEDDGRAQEGGTCLLVFDFLTSVVGDMGIDPTGLGRWCWTTFVGKDNHTTRLVAAYQPVRSSKRQLKSVYRQQRRYFQLQGDMRCPRAIFKDDLVKQLRQWKNDGERVVLMLDANEDLNGGPLSRALDAIDMRDAVRARTGTPGPATWFRGRNQIDGAFATQNVDCCGARFLPFWAGIGDHRAVVIDIPLQSLVGEQLLKVVRPPARRLQCTIERARRKYETILAQQFTIHRIHEKTAALYRQACYPPPPGFQEAVESLDRIRHQLMINAEKKCRKRRMGEVDFSPGVMVWQKRRDVWRDVVKHKLGGRINRGILARRARACGILSPLSATHAEAERAYRLCQREFDQLKPDADIHRASFLHDKEQQAEADGDLAAAKRFRTMIHRERSRKMWGSIRRAIKKKNGGSVTKVKVCAGGDWVEQSDRGEVESGIMVELTKRFRLTDSTPLMTGQLREDIGYLAATNKSDEILRGTYRAPSDTAPETKEMLKRISEVARLFRDQPIDINISKDDYIRYWRGSREKTSSSYSNTHFGHWKAAAFNDGLAEHHAMFIQLVCQSGTYLNRWSTGLTVMLEKVAGNFRVDKLRAILLMEADFNFANKLLFGSRMIHRAEQRKVLPIENYGSRNDHCSIEIALSRLLFFDVVRQRRCSAALASVDAHTCYDRIVHSFFSLGSQALGMPRGPLAAMLMAIQLMTFHLRTGHGDSERTYGGTSSNPFQGLCQGNGAAPAGWLVSSAFIVRQQHAQGHQVLLRAAISLVTIAFVAFMFVDDTDLPVIATSPDETPEDVGQRLQGAVTCWANSLGVTGGALKPEKCFWYSIGFSWTNGDPSYRTAQDTEIWVPDFSGTPTAIAHLGAHEAREVMGVWQTPSGDMTKQLAELNAKLVCWQSYITNGYLHRRVVWRAFWSTIWRTIQYPLPVLTMTPDEGDALMQTFYRTILPALGVNRNIHRVFRHTPTRYQGLGLPAVYLEQTVEQLTYFTMHASSDTSLGAELRASAEQIQLELGLGTQFFELSYHAYEGVTTDCWLKSLWRGLTKFRVKVRCSHLPDLPLQRARDHYLMDMFRRQGYDSDIIRSLNRVRLSLQVYSLADITTGDGTHIRYNFVECRQPRDVLPSPYVWPTEEPTNADRRLWVAALYDISSPSLLLPLHLGNWTSTPHRLHRWYYDPRSQSLFYQRRSTWERYDIDRDATRRTTTHSRASRRSVGAATLLPATVEEISDGQVRYTGSCEHAPNAPERPTSIEEIFTKWGHSWVWDFVQGIDDGRWIADAINGSTAILVCDGSYQPHLDSTLGSAAWIIQCSESGRRARGVLRSPGNIANAYRSELAGLYASLATVLAVCTLYEIETGSLRVCCDNERALFLSSSTTQRVSPRRRHSDILRAIRVVRGAIPLSLTFDHVRGHQDDRVMYQDLDLASQLNVDCDLLAKSFLQAAWASNQSAPQVLPHEYIAIFVDGEKVCGDVGPAIRNAYGRRKMRDHLAQRKLLSSRAFDLVDWDAVEKMMHKMPQQFRLWMTKHISKFCATNKQLFRMHRAQSPHCPCCNDTQVQEDTRHQMHCRDPKRYELLVQGIEDLTEWMESVHTEPTLALCISRYLRLRGLEDFAASPHLPSSLHTAARNQDIIGWDNFLEGRIATGFRIFQLAHYREIASRRVVDVWAAGLVERLVLLVHSQWIYRNAVVHERATDGLRREERAELKALIEEQFTLGVTDLNRDDHFLLEEDFDTVWQKSGPDKRTWLRAIRVAREAPTTRRRRRSHSSQHTQPPPQRRNVASTAPPVENRGTRRSQVNTGTTPSPVRRGTESLTRQRGRKRSRSVSSRRLGTRRRCKSQRETREA